MQRQLEPVKGSELLFGAGGLLIFIAIVIMAVEGGFFQNLAQTNRTIPEPKRTIDNAPHDKLFGELQCYYHKRMYASAYTSHIDALHENDFDVAFRDAHGDDVVFRYSQKVHEWNSPTEHGDIIELHRDSPDSSRWSGYMTDSSQGPDHVYFTMVFVMR